WPGSSVPVSQFLEGSKRVSEVASLTGGILVVAWTNRNPHRQGGRDGTYPNLHCPPTGICMRLHFPHSCDLRRHGDGLVSVLPPSVCYRVDPVERLDAPRASQPLPSFLQPGGLVSGSVVHGPGPAAGERGCPHGHDSTGRGRYAVPQTR